MSIGTFLFCVVVCINVIYVAVIFLDCNVYTGVSLHFGVATGNVTSF